MPIEFRCSGCGKKMKTGDAHAGKRGKCPNCGAVVDIPVVSEAPSPSSEQTSEQKLTPPSQPPTSPTLKGPPSVPSHNQSPTAPADPLADPLGDAAAGMYAPPPSPLPTAGPADYGLESYSTPSYPAPGYPSAPAHTPPVSNPYAAYGPAYGAAAPARSTTDTPGVISLVLGILSVVTMLIGCGLACALTPVGGPVILLFTGPMNLLMSTVGIVLAFYAKANMKPACLALHGVTLGAIAIVVLVFVVLLLLGVGIALTQ